MHATTALPRLSLLAAGLLLALAGPAHAVYKVVGPDGKVTYTDTPPPANSNAKVQSVAVGSGSGAPNLSNLPYELQQAASKYPVTLYAASGCRPCDSGRQLLRQRGIPFAEKRLSATPVDSEALQRLAGTAELPVLTIGQQQVKGLVASDWHSYLDAAGYPRESKLPASYRAPAATPMTAAAEPAAAAPAVEADTAAPAAAAPARPASGPNIRF